MKLEQFNNWELLKCEYPWFIFMDCVQAVEPFSQLLLDVLTYWAFLRIIPWTKRRWDYVLFGRRFNALNWWRTRKKENVVQRKTFRNCSNKSSADGFRRKVSYRRELRSQLCCYKTWIRIFSPEDGASHVLCFTWAFVEGRCSCFENHEEHHFWLLLVQVENRIHLVRFCGCANWMNDSFSNDNTKEEE